MSDGVFEPLLSAAELEKAVADAAEMQQMANDFVAWLKTPAAKAEITALQQEAATIWETFAQECKAGKFSLTPEELEQLFAEGRLVKCHTIKRSDQPPAPLREGGIEW